MKINEVTNHKVAPLLEYSREITAKNLAPKLVAALTKDNGDVGGLNQFKAHLANLKGQMPDDFTTNKVAEGVLAAIEAKDPTKNKQYTQWLARMYANGGVKLEDLNRNNVLNAFDLGKRRKMISAEHADINRFKSYREFESAILNNYDLDKIQDSDRGGLPKGEYTDVYNDANVRIIVPKNQDAACYLGQGTRWCTAATQGMNYFNRYNSEGPLYVMIPKSPQYDGEKYQLHFPSGQFMNEEDEQIDILELLELRFPGTIEFFKKTSPEIGDLIVFADDDIIASLTDKIQSLGMERVWDEVSDWESQDDGYYEYLGDQEEFQDEDGNIDWEKVADSGMEYLDWNDDARRFVRDMEDGLAPAPGVIRELASVMGHNDGEALSLNKLEEVIAQNLRDDYDEQGDFVADFVDRRVRVLKQGDDWEVKLVGQ